MFAWNTNLAHVSSCVCVYYVFIIFMVLMTVFFHYFYFNHEIIWLFGGKWEKVHSKQCIEKRISWARAHTHINLSINSKQYFVQQSIELIFFAVDNRNNPHYKLNYDDEIVAWFFLYVTHILYHVRFSVL